MNPFKIGQRVICDGKKAVCIDPPNSQSRPNEDSVQWVRFDDGLYQWRATCNIKAAMPHWVDGITSPDIIESLLPEIRKIRLYHWQAVMNLRSYAVGCPKDADKHYNKKADMHLGYVQTLNVFFEHGDTAERDLEKQANGKT